MRLPRWIFPNTLSLTVAVPNDRQPAARIADPARDLGLIEIRDSKPVDVTEIDVIKNPGGIKTVPASPARPASPPHGLRIHK
jgi:ABC-type metal ion transport system substrate-binding protein